MDAPSSRERVNVGEVLPAIKRWVADSEGSQCCWVWGSIGSDATSWLSDMPADNRVCTVDLRGKELDDAVEALKPWDGDVLRPFHHVAGLQLVVLYGLDTYLDSTGKVWEPQVRLLLLQLLGRDAPTDERWPRSLVTSALPPPAELTACDIHIVETAGRVDAADRSAGSHPPSVSEALESRVARLVAARDTNAALQLIGEWSNNVPPSDRIGAHRRLCRAYRALNGGHGPDVMSDALNTTGQLAPVLNQWTQSASSIGDVATASAGTDALARELAGTSDHGDRLQLHILRSHVALLNGDARAAAAAADECWNIAAEIHRMHEGQLSSEAAVAYDLACWSLWEPTVLLNGRSGVEALMTDRAALEAAGRDELERFNRHAIVPVEGPSGPVDREELLWGLPAAFLALDDGRPDEAIRILRGRREEWSSQGLAPNRFAQQLLRIGAATAAGDSDELDRAMAETAQQVAESGWLTAACDLVALEARVSARLGREGPGLDRLGRGLTLAMSNGLVLCWFNLLVARATVLAQDHRGDEAMACARAVIDGVGPGSELARRWPLAPAFGGAVDRGLLPICRAAREILVDAGDERTGASDTADDRLIQRRFPDRPTDRRIEAGHAQRQALHEAALGVLHDFETDGTPFALFLRRFGPSILHGPAEFGMRTLENHLRDALAEGVRCVAIQQPTDLSGLEYAGLGTAFDRNAPALSVEDDEWREVADGLIANADIILAECTSLSAGIAYELDRAHSWGRWDRTVLALPPLKSHFQMLDSHPLVQRFPRCFWLDELHTHRLTELPPVIDLIERIESIVSSPAGGSRLARAPSDRDEMFPIDLLKLANSYEAEVVASTVLGVTDDRTPYYAFWQLFRAAGIRGHLLSTGEGSLMNRLRLAEAYLQMATIMLTPKTDEENDLIIIVADLDFARKAGVTVHNLFDDEDPPSLTERMQQQALALLEQLDRVERAVQVNPDRVILRPEYGPITMADGT